jgi:hypothetical protein
VPLGTRYVWGVAALKSSTVHALACAAISFEFIHVGAEIVSHGRYVAFRMAEVTISKNLFADILRMIAELRPPTNPAPA